MTHDTPRSLDPTHAPLAGARRASALGPQGVSGDAAHAPARLAEDASSTHFAGRALPSELLDGIVIDIILSNGDRAGASDPESALVAARTLINDWRDAHPYMGARKHEPTVSFYVDGQAIRTHLTRREIF